MTGDETPLVPSAVAASTRASIYVRISGLRVVRSCSGLRAMFHGFRCEVLYVSVFVREQHRQHGTNLRSGRRT